MKNGNGWDNGEMLWISKAEYEEKIRDASSKAVLKRERGIAKAVRTLADETGPQSARMSAYKDVLEILNQ